jgi:F0F1-type ATP synthase assembly protein I
VNDPRPQDDRSTYAKAIEKASQVTTVALVMVVPSLLGYWLDSWLRTVPLFTALGLLIGMPAGIWQLIRMVNRDTPGSTGHRSP